MYNQNLISFWEEHQEEEPEFSDYLENQQVYNFKTINTECASIHIFDDKSILIQEDDQEMPSQCGSLGTYLNEILLEVSNNLSTEVQCRSIGDMERVDFVMEVIEAHQKLMK